MSYIYKITNLITNKIYIGYTSRTIYRRFYEHKWAAINYEENKNKESYLYNSMRKYGTDNFIITPLLEFNESEQNWQDLEQFYIKKFNTLVPNGYNLLKGGNKPPIHCGDNNVKTKVLDKDLNILINYLKNPQYSYKEISNKFNISISQLYNINMGRSRHIKNIDYPIRKYSQQEIYALKVMNMLNNDITLSNQKIADLIPNYFRANEIASINNGNKYSYLWDGDFPIRKIKVPNDFDEKQKIALNIINYLEKNNYKVTQIQIQKDLNYSRTVVEKTLKGTYPYSISNRIYPIKLNN